MNKCRKCGKEVEKKSDLRCSLCRKEVDEEVVYKLVSRPFDYYFRHYKNNSETTKS